MEFLFAALTVISVTILGAASPGPDTALIFKHGLLGSRRNAFATVLGIITGNVLYVIVAVLGLGVILVNSGFAYTFVQLLGAVYLLYLGIQLLKSHSEESVTSDRMQSNGMTARHAYQEGLMTNALNPKFVLFLIALFSQVIHPEWSFLSKLFLGMLVPLTAFCVFSFLVYTITHPKFRNAIARSRVVIERIMGAVLVALAAKVFMSTFK